VVNYEDHPSRAMRKHPLRQPFVHRGDSGQAMRFKLHCMRGATLTASDLYARARHHRMAK